MADINIEQHANPQLTAEQMVEALRQAHVSNNNQAQHIAQQQTQINQQQAQIQELHQNVTQLMQQQQQPPHQVATQAATGSQGPAGLRAPKPEKFDGLGKNVDPFFYSLEAHFKLAGPGAHTDTQKVTWAKTLLTGTALRWMVYVEQQVANKTMADPFTSWDDFKKAVRAHFKAANTEVVARERLNTLQQMGSIIKYSDLFNATLADVMSMDEQSKISAYIRGLKSADVKLEVRRTKPQTLEEAQAAAFDADNILHENRTTANYKGRSSNGQFMSGGRAHHTSAAPMDLGEAEQEQDEDAPQDEDQCAAVDSKGRARLSPEEHERCRKNNLCFNCKRSGHRSRDCPHKSKQGKD